MASFECYDPAWTGTSLRALLRIDRSLLHHIDGPCEDTFMREPFIETIAAIRQAGILHGRAIGVHITSV